MQNDSQFYPSHLWTKSNAHFVYSGPFKEDLCFYIDLNTLEAFRVDTDTDLLSAAEIERHKVEVEAADLKEIK